MAWATKLGSTRVQTKDAIVERAAAIQLGQYGLPYLNTWDVQRAVNDGYERVMWVFRAIDAIASNAAQLPMVLRKGDADRGDVVTDHPALDMMNNKANVFETADVFWYRLFSQYLLSKKGVFVEVRYNRGGDPAEMYLLPPHWTNPIPDPDNFVSAYRVMIPGGQAWVDVPATDPTTGLPKVVWVRKPHPIDPYSGVTPLESVGLSIDIDFYARLYNRAFLQNDGRPGGIVAVKGELNDRDAEEMRRRFSAGPNKAGATAVIEADDLAWVDVSTTPRDAQYIESRGITKEEILLAFGVPESIMGNASGRTYDNADAEKLVFWQETMQFHLRLVSGFFDFFTDDDFKTVFDTSSIAVLRRDREQEEDHDKGLVTTGLMTIDEFRDKHGRDKFDTPATRALWLPNNLVAQPAEGDQDAFVPVAPAEPGHPAAAAPDALPRLDSADPSLPPGAPKPPAPVALPAASGDGANKSVVRPKPAAGLSQQMRQGIIEEAEKQRAYFEQKAKDTAAALFKRQKKVVLAKVKGTKARKGTRHWVNQDGREPVITKKLHVDDVFDRKRWDDEWTDEFSDLGGDILGTVSDNVADEFGAQDDYDANDEESAAAIALMARAHGKQAAQANETTKQAIANLIQANEEDDQDIEELEDGIGDYFDQSADIDNGRASDIGTWFAVGAISMGAMHAAQSIYGDDGTESDGNDDVITKGWVSMQDGLVRASHVEADSAYGNADGSIPLDEPFSVNGVDLMYPGDPEGDPGETINCRCVMVFYRDGAETDDSRDDEKSLQRKYSDDQPRDDHGRFGSGGGGSSDGSGFKPISDGLFEMAKEGGFTYQPTTADSPKTGIAVARDGTSAIIKDDKFFESKAQGKQYIADYLKEHRSEFKEKTAHLGGWHDTEHGEFVLDISDVLQDKDQAIALGRERNQQAVFDLSTFDTIDTGGTGGREDESQHKTAGSTDTDAGRPRADGRGNRSDSGADGEWSAGLGFQELTDADVLAKLFDQLDLEEKFDESQVLRDDHGRFADQAGAGSPGGGGDAVNEAERQETLHEAAEHIPGTDPKTGRTVDFEERRAYLDKVIHATQPTLNTHALYDNLPGGKNIFTPERAAAQKQIIDDVYARNAQVPNNGQAIVTGGLPGSGKTSGMEAAFSKGWLEGKSSDYLVLNPDDMKDELAKRGLTPDEDTDPRFAGMSPMEKAGLIHEESSYLTTQLAQRAYADNKNVIWDITMNKESSVAARLDDLKANGYRTQMIFTDTDPDKATARAAGRYENGQKAYEAGENLVGGRFVSSDITGYKPNDEWVTQNRAVFETLKNRSDQWVSIDNNGDRDPKLIEKSS